MTPAGGARANFKRVNDPPKELAPNRREAYLSLLRFVRMSIIIFWTAALVVGISFLVFVKRKIRSRRENSDRRSLSLLGTVSQQWLIGHRAEN